MMAGDEHHKHEKPSGGGGRRLRALQRRRYTEEYADEEDLLDFEGRAFDVDEKLVSDRFDAQQYDFVREMTGDQLTIAYIQDNGFEKPIVIKQMKGLGMKIPADTFTVNDVKQCVGSRRVLDVMDVETQRDFTMSMKEWCEYYCDPNRDRLLNVISLEFSHTKLEQHVDSPYIVKQVDWIDWVWPKHLKQSQTEGTNIIEDMKYPKVQKYCLMSVKGCYTDFHIDFGGTSVWYHILKGRKVFWLIPPTERNIQLYESWVLSGKQSDVFFGDQVDHCARVHLEAGYTFFIPTGWIHAVYTPEDSLVFGGNFLHSFSIEKQLRVAQVEDATKVPMKFRYPFYTEVLWYVLARYVYCLMNKNHLKCNEEGVTIVKNNDSNDIKLETKPVVSFPPPPHPLPVKSSVHLTPYELSGLKAVIMWLQKLPPNKRSLPDLIVSAEALLSDAQILIDDHNQDVHHMAVTGRPVLFWTKKSATQSLTSQLRQIRSPTVVLKQMRNKEATINATVTTKLTPRPESPPTRPISSNQYSINSGATLNQDLIPSSFAGLIAQTGVNNFQPFTAITSAPLIGAIGSPPQTAIPSMVSYMSPTALPPPPPLISSPTISPNGGHNSYQTVTANTTQSLHKFTDYNMNSMNKKPLNINAINEPNNGLNKSYNTTATQSQQSFANYFIENHKQNNGVNVKQNHSPPMPVTTGVETQTMPPKARPFPTAVPPSGFHSTANQNEPMFVNKMVNSSTQSSFPSTTPSQQQKLFVSTASGTTDGSGVVSGSGGAGGKSSSNDSSRRRRTRCKKCDSCLRADCGECHFCKDMKKFGGPGRMKQSCIARQCLAPVLPHTACCMICGRDGWEKLVEPSIADETASSLMECSQCWEIVHPFCLNDKFPQFLAINANINEELPNSWECPRCVKTGAKSNGKYNNKSKQSTGWTPIKKEMAVGPDGPDGPSPGKKPRLSADDSPPTTDDEEDTKPNVTANRTKDQLIGDDTDNSNSSSSAHKLYPTSGSAHVRSCARFPLLSQGLQQMASPTMTPTSPSSFVTKNSQSLANNTTNKSEVKGLAALMHCKKKNGSSRDRLFKSLKGLKKTSEQTSRSSLGTASGVSKKSSHKSNGTSTSMATITTSSSVTTHSICSSNSNSSLSSSYAMTNSPSGVGSQPPINQNNFSSISGKLDVKRDINDESTDDEVEPIVQLNGVKNGKEFDTKPVPHREIIKPKYVVRPAPLDCDISSSEESVETSDASDDDSTTDIKSKSIRKAKQKAMQKHLRKFRTKLSGNLALHRDVILPVMRYLSRKDLLNCMLVNKSWNGFTIDPKLWPHLDLSHKKMTADILKGIVRRQPRYLNLSWTAIKSSQVFWLICRLPQLETLSLAGCHVSVVSALITCNCPKMASLDISFIHGLDDNLISRLLSPPNDTRPGLMESFSRLRFLNVFNIAGTDISDKSIRLITQNLPFVTRLDLSCCTQITDLGIAALANARARHLSWLNVSGCRQISDMSLQSLRVCPSILFLDIRECPLVNRSACSAFIARYPPQTKLICN